MYVVGFETIERVPQIKFDFNKEEDKHQPVVETIKSIPSYREFKLPEQAQQIRYVLRDASQDFKETRYHPDFRCIIRGIILHKRSHNGIKQKGKPERINREILEEILLDF
jgi:hypothetical protein